MRPVTTTTTTTTTTVNGSIHQWNSPIPYLFSGLAVMLGLIAFALVILACSYKKSSSSSSSSSSNSSTHAGEKPVRPPPEMEPKIVVIMAGDENPTYLAKPVSSSQAQHTEQV
ncbi:hypothetical protein CsSME_00005327 [Camellia sinensis var. sinensis]|uniref:protein GLUTAMINE DUMPER 5-like n=1 Tax=Camellia sinensis TaxID=4442 RepID=UPI0010365B63|nr:protein GLUTAMINE DUMPER 5-like [Camellia sinensis]